jgi:hypothetical protein
MFSDSLVIKIKQKAKYICVAITLLFYILQKYLTKVSYFSRIYYHTKFHDPTLSSINDVPTSEDCTAAKFDITEHKKLERCSSRVP